MSHDDDKDIEDLRALAQADGRSALSEHEDREAQDFAMHCQEHAAICDMRRASAALSRAKAGRATAVANLVGSITFLLLAAALTVLVVVVVRAIR